MKRDKDYLQELEESLLMATLRLDHDGEPPYGATIQRKLRDWGRESSLGSIHATMNRLEKKGYLASSESKSLPQRGGKKRRIFTVTDKGKVAIKAVRGYRQAIYEDGWANSMLMATG